MGNAWTTDKLGTRASVVASNVDKHVHEDEIPASLCNYLDVYRNRRISKPYQFSDGSVTQAELDRYTIQKGDVLITKDSETPDDIGVPCLIADEFENTVCGYHLALIRTKDALNPSFLSYVFQSEATRRYFLAKAAGLTRFGLNARTIRGVPIPMVPPDEQAAIADVLDAVEHTIAKARAVIEKAEHAQKGLMQQLMTGRLKTDGTPRTEKDFWAHPKAGFVPIGWEVLQLKQLAQVQRGKFSHRPRNEPRFYGGRYPFIQTGDVSNSRGYILSHAQTLSDEGTRISRRFPKGTVFITIVGVNVAATAIAAYEVYATDSVIGMIPNAGVVSEYLEFYLRSVQQKLAVLAGNSARENLNYGILKPLLVKYPTDPKEQQRVANTLCNCDSLIRAKERKIVALQRLKKSLLQNLLTGRVRLTLKADAQEAIA
jgi:type I restriction enzyme, S subunit